MSSPPQNDSALSVWGRRKSFDEEEEEPNLHERSEASLNASPCQDEPKTTTTTRPEEDDNGLAELSASRWGSSSFRSVPPALASAPPRLPPSHSRSPSRTSSSSSSSSLPPAAPPRRGLRPSQSLPLQSRNEATTAKSWLSSTPPLAPQKQLELEEEEEEEEEEAPAFRQGLVRSGSWLTSSSSGWTAPTAATTPSTQTTPPQQHPKRSAPSPSPSIGSQRNSDILLSNRELKEENELLREQVKMLQATLREKEDEKRAEDVHTNLEALENSVQFGGRRSSMSWRECGANSSQSFIPVSPAPVTKVVQVTTTTKEEEKKETPEDTSPNVANLALERAIAFSMELAESRALVDSLKSELQVAQHANERLQQKLVEATQKLAEAEQAAAEAEEAAASSSTSSSSSSSSAPEGPSSTPSCPKCKADAVADETSNDNNKTQATKPRRTTSITSASISATTSWLFFGGRRASTGSSNATPFSPPEKTAPDRFHSTDSLCTADTFASSHASGWDGNTSSSEGEEAAPPKPTPKQPIIASC